MPKASAVLLNINPTGNAKDQNSNYRFQSYSYNRIDTHPWQSDTQKVGDGGKPIQTFKFSDMDGANFRFYIVTGTQSWSAPQVTITFKDKVTKQLATPFTMQNPSTVAFTHVPMGNGDDGWYYDATFTQPPVAGKYVYEISAVFTPSSGGPAEQRTYYVDPEMDCSSDSK